MAYQKVNDVAAMAVDQTQGSALASGLAAGNVRLCGATAVASDATTERAREKSDSMRAQFEQRQRMRKMVVPTTDTAIKARLRELGAPITMFGEDSHSRRERLRGLLMHAELQPGGAAAAAAAPALPGASGAAGGAADGAAGWGAGGAAAAAGGAGAAELFYTEGTHALRDARTFVAKYSLPLAAERISGQKRKLAAPADGGVDPAASPEWGSRLRALENSSSQIGDERPVSACKFRPDGAMLASASWSGAVKLWDVPSCALRATLRGHTERVRTVAWHPEAQSMSPQTACLASASADKTVRLWSTGSATPVATLEGHFDRVNCAEWHPSGRFVASASHDRSWRLWDAETGTSLLQQEGHSRAVYCLAFQSDGSLLVTAGLDCLGRVWDLRSGKCVLSLQGHVKQILGTDFHPNGYELATGADDKTVRLWDLRKRACTYVIPAHSALISSLRYAPGHGSFLISSSYDNTCKLWDTSTRLAIRTLAGHENKVMCADVVCPADGGVLVATASFDRVWKLWKEE